jgi:hypothetical protein
MDRLASSLPYSKITLEGVKTIKIPRDHHIRSKILTLIESATLSLDHQMDFCSSSFISPDLSEMERQLFGHIYWSQSHIIVLRIAPVDVTISNCGSISDQTINPRLVNEEEQNGNIPSGDQETVWLIRDFAPDMMISWGCSYTFLFLFSLLVVLITASGLRCVSPLVRTLFFLFYCSQQNEL